MDKKTFSYVALLFLLMVVLQGTIVSAEVSKQDAGSDIFSGADLTKANFTITPSSTPTETPTPTHLPKPERYEWTPPPPTPPSKGVFEIGFTIIALLLIGLIVLGYYILRGR